MTTTTCIGCGVEIEDGALCSTCYVEALEEAIKRQNEDYHDEHDDE